MSIISARLEFEIGLLVDIVIILVEDFVVAVDNAWSSMDNVLVVGFTDLLFVAGNVVTPRGNFTVDLEFGDPLGSPVTF